MTANLNKDFVKYCLVHKLKLEKNIGLSKYTSFRIGGPANFFLNITSKPELKKLFLFPHLNDLPYKIIGGGTNLLISSQSYQGLIIKLCNDFSKLDEVSPGQFIVASSVRSSFFAKKVSTLGYSGFEFLASIPGTIGGAFIQNAGCYGANIMQFVSKVEYFENNTFKEKRIEEIKFAYRWTEFKNTNSVITAIHFKKFPRQMPYQVGTENYNSIQKKINENKINRIKNQPSNKKSAGSVFKNPVNQSAWKLISDCGLQGKTKGDAIISNKHANFILNRGKASSQDVYYLICLIEEKVFKKFGIKLEREIELLGKF